MPLAESDRAFFSSVLPSSEIVDRASADFTYHTVPWSLSHDKSPKLALAPSSVSDLQQIVKYLYEHDNIDFTIRGRGVGSTSAHDVILSMRNFMQVNFEQAGKFVEIGAGLDWGDVDSKLETLAPGYVVVGARCPYVGVTGSTLAGGLSWLSHELGLGSDSDNLLDAHIILRDGRALWASEEPDLLWALRGGGGNFGVVTTLRLRAHPSPSTIYAGMLHFPPTLVPRISTLLSHWVKSYSSPKTALHLFVFDFSAQSLHGLADPSLVAIIFDALGEDHARNSDEGFKWLFGLPGLREDMMGPKTLAGVHELQRSTEKAHGTARSWLQAALVGDEDVDEDFLVRAWDWYHSTVTSAPELALGTFALFEVMQSPAFNSSTSPTATAWPHGGKGRQHVMQMSVGGGPPTADEVADESLKKKALDILARGPALISGRTEHPASDFLPNFLLENHDIQAVYGGNWGVLRAVKGLYDPKGRFGRGDAFVPPALDQEE